MRAHPRVCGENLLAQSATQLISGSSPRVRGKLRGVPCRFVENGLIPACAGKTRGNGCRARRAWAHPRVCGENQIKRSDSPKTTGSSPRMRGKHRLIHAGEIRGGLIPAYAGKTLIARIAGLPIRAHPRVCGENSNRSFQALSVAGSSPRMRGKPLPAL